MGLADLLLAFGLNQGAHTYGHVSEADQSGIPITVSWDKFVENWDAKKIPPKIATQIHGAGFSAQDIIGQALQDKNYNLIDGLYKLGYLSGIPGKFAKEMIPGGDVGGMERTSGNPYVRSLLGATAVADLIKSQNPNIAWDLGFSTMGLGAPGIVFTVPVDQWLRPVFSRDSRRR